MNDSGRPLSPHLSVYRWPITMTLSILHRVTGAGLSVGLLVLAIWLISAASGKNAFDQVNGLLQSGVGRLLLIGCSLAFFFHLCNGIRHLFWDAGRGFEKNQANASSWIVIITTIILTLAYWLVIAGT
jgi:succinate dehydrogenase / fumarate reductase cytochrome b subunit